MQTVEPKTLEVTLQDQAVELEVLQEFPSYLICEDGVLVEPDGTLIEEFDMGEVLDRDIDTDLVPKRPPQAEEVSEQSFAAAFGAAATSRFDHALDWINPLVGKMPYGFWHAGEVPSGSPAWALNRRPPTQGLLARHKVFCAGVTNLMLRRVGKRVPTRGNAFFDGGTVAYWSYFDGFHRPFSLKEVRRGDLLLRRFRNNSVDQGHVAVSLGNGPDAPLLQLFHSNGRGLPGLNKGVSVRSSHAVIHYERLVRVQNWINYKGDEF
jgi:hypothetical protein